MGVGTLPTPVEICGQCPRLRYFHPSMFCSRCQWESRHIPARRLIFSYEKGDCQSLAQTGEICYDIIAYANIRKMHHLPFSTIQSERSVFMGKIALGILFGGASSEYEVSLLSAASVLKNIDPEQYDIYKIGITKDGRMFYYTGHIDRISADKWQGADCVPCVISPDRGHHGILLLGSRTEVLRLDCVFPVLHGKNGEDGTMQGLLSLAGIPYVGCGYRASADCMDKIITHTILDAAGIDGTKWLGITEFDYRRDEEGFASRAAAELGFPCFVKPANAGSSVGITKVKSPEEFSAAMNLAFEHDSRVIVERMIYGIELECAVLGNDEPIASCVGEIAPISDFYDYDAKYNDGTTKTYAPARIPEQTADAIRELAVRAYRAMGCEGCSRVDFFLEKSGRILLNEINTIPGFTQISMYPQLFIESGLSYSALIDRLIRLALERGE